MQAMAEHFSHHQCTTINYNVRVFKWHRQASDEEVQRLRVSALFVYAPTRRSHLDTHWRTSKACCTSVDEALHVACT
jgi:hypothetical protein